MLLTTAASRPLPLDWIVLAGYFGILVASGIWFSRREQRNTEDYFLAGRRMPAWAVAISIVATSMSAASFIGVPQTGYASDLTYLSTNIGMVIAALIIAVFFIPAFYRARVQTIYELLEHRYSPSAKQAASWTFLVGRVMASGARVYIGAIPASLMVFGDLDIAHLLIAICVLGAVGTLYTLVGGVASVIWTDVIQMGVLLGACVAAIVLILVAIPASPGDIIDALRTAEGGSKLRLFDTSLDPSAPFTLLASVIAFTLMGIGSYGTDQDLAQRMLTCRSAKRGSWAVIGGILAGIPSVALFLVVGLLLYVFYRRPDLMGASARPPPDTDSRRIFLDFIMTEMPAGLTGLMMAGLFAAGLSSLNSAINAMGSSFINDFYRLVRPDRTERHYLGAGRAAVVAWGIILTAFACICALWQNKHGGLGEGGTLLTFALRVMTFAYAGLIAVFVSAILTKRGSTASVIGALVTGFLAVLLMQLPWGAMVNALFDAPPSTSPIALAFPWQLVIATSLAFAVCQLGRPRANDDHAPV